MCNNFYSGIKTPQQLNSKKVVRKDKIAFTQQDS